MEKLWAIGLKRMTDNLTFALGNSQVVTQNLSYFTVGNAFDNSMRTLQGFCDHINNLMGWGLIVLFFYWTVYIILIPDLKEELLTKRKKELLKTVNWCEPIVRDFFLYYIGTFIAIYLYQNELPIPQTVAFVMILVLTHYVNHNKKKRRRLKENET